MLRLGLGLSPTHGAAELALDESDELRVARSRCGLQNSPTPAVRPARAPRVRRKFEQRPHADERVVASPQDEPGRSTMANRREQRSSAPALD